MSSEGRFERGRLEKHVAFTASSYVSFLFSSDSSPSGSVSLFILSSLELPAFQTIYSPEIIDDILSQELGLLVFLLFYGSVV